MPRSNAQNGAGQLGTIRHAGVMLSWLRGGTGPPLVLVHGSFSDHRSNWDPVRPLLEPHFALYAVARRGRGDTDATTDHSLADEAGDVAAIIDSIGAPVFLLGHSHGALVAVEAAAMRPARIHKLILYEPPWPTAGKEAWTMLRDIAETGDWDAFTTAFYRDAVGLPPDELKGLRNSELWPPMVQDAPATTQDFQALLAHEFDPSRFRSLSIPTLLQFGTHSPRAAFVTDALHETLPDVRLDEMHDEGHDAMMTSPAQFADSVKRFLLT